MACVNLDVEMRIQIKIIEKKTNQLIIKLSAEYFLM